MNCQALITRLPYPQGNKKHYDAGILREQIAKVDARGLVCLSVPIHVDAPDAPFRLMLELQKSGLELVACVSWFRDRHIVTQRSRRLSNTWEPLFIFAKSDEYIFNRDAATKVKKGFEGREGAFDEDEYRTCIGDHWPIRNDQRNRIYLPAQVTLNCGQLAGLQPGMSVLDPFYNPGIEEACELLGWKYVDGGLPGAFPRDQKKKKPAEEPAAEQKNEEETSNEG